MKPLQTFEPPKNGEKIFSNTIIWRNQILIGVFILLLTFGLGYILKRIFKYNDTTDTVVSLIIIFTLSFLSILIFVIKQRVFNIFYFDDYLQLDDYKISYKSLDNFVYDEDDKIVRISFTPNVPDDIVNDIPKYFLHKSKTEKSQWLKVNSKYKKVRIDLINYLNNKIKNY